MNLTQPYEEVKIEIISMRFDKEGYLDIEGLVNGEPIDVFINAGMPEFDELKPIEPAEYECIDEDDLYNACVDDYFNIHWLIKVGGNVLNRVVRLKSFAEQLLYDKFINQ